MHTAQLEYLDIFCCGIGDAHAERLLPCLVELRSLVGMNILGNGITAELAGRYVRLLETQETKTKTKGRRRRIITTACGFFGEYPVLNLSNKPRVIGTVAVGTFAMKEADAVLATGEINIRNMQLARLDISGQ